MEVRPDFRELLELFNAHGVEYLIVGGLARAFHGAPRFTADMDLFVRQTEANYHRIVEALKAFGFSGAPITLEEFLLPGEIFQMGVPPLRIDIITSISGVTWDQASAGRMVGKYGTAPAHFIGLKEFLANKTASGRPKDVADVEAMRLPKKHPGKDD
jgi:hypothetical protein